MANHKKKTPWMAIIRRSIQVLSFILMPGLFISTFSSIKAIYMAIISGTFDFGTLLPQMLIILAVIPATILMGRVFCGFICSFGSLGDLIWFISRKLRRKPFRINEKADRVLKSFKYILLAFIVVFIWTLGAVTIDNSLNPWNIFGMYASISGWTSAAGLLTVGFALLLLIMAGSFFVERFFCRYVCPLGAVFAVVSKLRVFKIKKPSEKCGACKACTVSCSMGIPMYKYDKINSGECIDCFQCLKACPRKNTQASIAGQDVAPLAAGLITTAAIMGVYYIGKLAPSATTTTALAASISEVTVLDNSASNITISGDYTDGVYTGSAPGYKGTTAVQVTVENGYITNIEIVSTDDDGEFFNMAKNAIISDILQTQSAQVDAVTGATYSSDAIMNAVADALGTAGAAVAAQPTATLAPLPTAIATTSPDTTTAATETAVITTGTYADGVYTGTGSGFRGQTEVSVTVSGGQITDIQIVSYQDDRQYFEPASSSVISDIISTQSASVDAVSGATFSSNGIMEAVANALGVSYTNANSTLPSGHGDKGDFGEFEDD